MYLLLLKAVWVISISEAVLDGARHGPVVIAVVAGMSAVLVERVGLGQSGIETEGSALRGKSSTKRSTDWSQIATETASKSVSSSSSRDHGATIKSKPVSLREI